MPTWNPYHGWMAFERLDEGHGLTRAFTIGYRLTDDRTDPWTRRFNGFKNRERTALRGGAAVMGTAFPISSRLSGWTQRTRSSSPPSRPRRP